jgi:hypothetical protein
MPYTSSDILQLKKLAYHADVGNVLLAYELFKSQGWDERLTTVLYWIWYRTYWEQNNETAREVARSIQQHAPALVALPPLLEWTRLPIPIFFEKYYPAIQQSQLSCQELAEALAQVSSYGPNSKERLAPFVFRFGSLSVQKAVLPKLLKRRHTGTVTLDLNNQQFTQVPSAVFEVQALQELNLDNNHLTALPDQWEQLPQLEILHLTNNELTTLPTSFTQLQQLKRLYIQDNPWKIPQLSATLQALPALEYLSVGGNASKPLVQLEALVQHGLLQASPKEQRLFLAFDLQDLAALGQLSTLELFEGLRHEHAAIRELARQRLLHLSPAAKATKHSAVAVLGLVSFAVRSHLDALRVQGWKITNEIQTSTTHILLGDYPEQFGAVAERDFVFISEEEVLDWS